MQIDKDVLKVLNEDYQTDAISSALKELHDLLNSEHIQDTQQLAVYALANILNDLNETDLSFSDLWVNVDGNYPYISFHWLGHWTNVPYNTDPVDLCDKICSAWDSMPWAFDDGSSDGWEMAKDDFETICNIVNKYSKVYDIPISVDASTKANLAIIPGSTGFNGEVTEWTSEDMANNYNVSEDDIKEYFTGALDDFDSDELEDYDYTGEDRYDPLTEVLGFDGTL